MSFISSNKYFRAAYGEKLRHLLGRNTRLDQIIDFRDAPVFDATNYPCIVILQDQPPNGNKSRVLSWKPGEPIESFEKIFVENSFSLDQNELTSEGWRLEVPEVLRLLRKLMSSGTPLQQYVGGRFYYGIKTGLNEAFVVDRATRKKLISAHNSSSNLLKPFLRGRDVKRWRVEFAEQYLIRIESSENRHHEWTGKSLRQAEKVFSETYPAIYEWLKSFRSGLINRDDQGKYFWELRSCAYWDEFEKPKIVIPSIERTVSYAVDNDKYYSNDKTTICVTADTYFLTAVLNSKLLWWIIRKTASEKQGGFYEFKPMYVSPLPIPEADKEQKALLSTFAKYLIELKRTLPEANQGLEHSRDELMVAYFEQIIDAMVYELFLPEELHKSGKHFFKPLSDENFPDLEDIKGDKVSALRPIFSRLFDQHHVVRQNIFFLNTLESVRIIEGKHETLLNRD